MQRVEEERQEMQDALGAHNRRTNCLFTSYMLFQWALRQSYVTHQQIDLLFWPLVVRLANGAQLNLRSR